ncbi:MAG: epoxyqueuosine reductase [Archaeoglobi archaeon]|nr:epoxyqueuosine reductase [Archaeoglobi archaeon]MDK2781488.1 epoxyqueuosine reductase [Archaeoglobi archaeon]
MPLRAGEPMKNRCGECRACVERCPSGAIRDSSFEEYPESRESVFDVERCVEETGKYLEDPDIGARVCGECIRVCPVGRKATSSRRQS